MGLGVELLQSRALGGLLPKARLWTFASVAGHLIPFLAYDLTQAAGLSVLYSLHVCVALSGVIAGALQQPSTSRLLYPEVPILGLITGVVLVRLPRRSAAAVHAASRGA